MRVFTLGISVSPLQQNLKIVQQDTYVEYVINVVIRAFVQARNRNFS